MGVQPTVTMKCLRTLCLVVCTLVQLGVALQPVISRSGFLLTNTSSQIITMNGIWYTLSNSTTDPIAMDPLTDGEACRRDAAVMTTLGINTLYVPKINPTLNHDDCFSIFNSVGIYIVAVLSWGDRPFLSFEQGYEPDLVRTAFEMIDALKDYENLMAVDIGFFWYSFAFNEEQTITRAQKLFKALLRDTKQYVARNAPRPILVGGSINYEPDSWTFESQFHHFTCRMADDEDDTSYPDFVGLGIKPVTWDELRDTEVEETIYHITRIREDYRSMTPALFASDYGAPYNYSRMGEETRTLYNVSTGFPFNGGFRYQWTNVDQSPYTRNRELLRVDSNGDSQLTEGFDKLREFFDQENTESWRGGNILADNQEDFKMTTCATTKLQNTTGTVTQTDMISSSYTIATDWELPSQPAGVVSLIASGAKGTRGQMVDVIETSIPFTIRDSKGDIMTDIVLKPSSSQKRSTTAASPSSTGLSNVGSSSNSNELSTGVKAGIGVGSAVGALALGGVILLFVLRRRRKNKSKTNADEKVSGESKDVLTSVKPELPGHEAAVKRNVELPAESAGPVELPAIEKRQELGGKGSKNV